MTDRLPPELVRQVDRILEHAWAQEVEARRATDERLRKAQEAMASTERLLAQMREAETERLPEELAAWDQRWTEICDSAPPDLDGGC